MRAIASETKGASLPCKLSCRRRGKSVCQKVVDAMRQRTLDHGGGAKMLDTVVVESTPRHSTASNVLAERVSRTTGEQLRTLRDDTQHLEKARVTPSSAMWPCVVRYSGFCATRYERGAGGIIPFRATCDRDYTQEIFPSAETILFKILAS